MDESIKLILESVVAKILIANFGNGLLLEQQIISMLGNILSLRISGLWKDSSELAMVADRVKINIFDVVSVSGSVISDFIELSKNPNLRSSDRIDEAMNLNSQILPFNCETKLPAKYTFKRTPVNSKVNDNLETLIRTRSAYQHQVEISLSRINSSSNATEAVTYLENM